MSMWDNLQLGPVRYNDCDKCDHSDICVRKNSMITTVRALTSKIYDEGISVKVTCDKYLKINNER